MRNLLEAKKINIIDLLVNSITNKFNEHLNLDGFKLQKLHLGVTILIVNLTKMIVLITVALYLNLLKEYLIMFSIFFFIRMSSFGLHANNSYICTLVSLSFLIGGAAISEIIIIDKKINIILYIVSIFMLIRYSPADTENRPLIGENVRRNLFVKTIITTLLLLSINLILRNNVFNNMLLITIIFQDICILPITYKILGRRYKNYEKYE